MYMLTKVTPMTALKRNRTRMNTINAMTSTRSKMKPNLAWGRMSMSPLKYRAHSASDNNDIGAPASIAIRRANGKPRPRLISNTLDPMALDTAMSP